MLNPPLNVVLKGNDRIGFTVDSAVKSVFHMLHQLWTKIKMLSIKIPKFKCIPSVVCEADL